jgi:oligopeptide/dipeptide ABC transporter ATP-binding protein
MLAGLAFNLTGESIARALGVASLGNFAVSAKARAKALAAAAPGPGSSPVDPGRDDDALLAVTNLRVTFPTATADIQPVRGVSFSLRPGEAVGLVGESGSGKSLTALAIAQLIEEPGEVTADRLDFLGTDLLHGGPGAIRHLLGTSLAMVFQDPMTSLNPTMRVGSQLAELAQHHGGLTRAEALARAVDRLDAVRIPEAEYRAHQYPHEFSGGMRQRAMIGLGVMLAPQLIIADEPTTALDVTVQEQVLDLLQSIRRTDGVALLLISHDVTVVAEVSDRVLVMYAGRLVEDLPAARLHHASHPYTRLLVAAVPTMTTDLDAPLPTIPGRPVEPADVPAGCAFAPRCPLADDRCRAEDPELAPTADGQVACWHPDDEVVVLSAAKDLNEPDAGSPGGSPSASPSLRPSPTRPQGAIPQAKSALKEAVGEARSAARGARDEAKAAVSEAKSALREARDAVFGPKPDGPPESPGEDA